MLALYYGGLKTTTISCLGIHYQKMKTACSNSYFSGWAIVHGLFASGKSIGPDV